MRVNEVIPKPRNEDQKAAKFTPLRLGKAKPFSALSLSWLGFSIWQAVAFITGLICGGFIVAAFFRSRGW